MILAWELSTANSLSVELMNEVLIHGLSVEKPRGVNTENEVFTAVEETWICLRHVNP